MLILGEQMIFDDFPWNVVGLLIEYEPQVNTPWKEICAKMMIKHLSFQAILYVINDLCCLIISNFDVFFSTLGSLRLRIIIIS